MVLFWDADKNIIIPCEFFAPVLADSLSLEFEWQQDFSGLSILTGPNKDVVWIISACPSISNSASLLTKPLRIVSSAPITVVITVTSMFHSFFSTLARCKYCLFSFSLIFTLWSAGMTKFTIRQVHSFSFLIIIQFGLLVGIRLSVCIQEKSVRRILSGAYTTCLYGQMSVSCTIPSGSSSLPSCVEFIAFDYYVINRFVSFTTYEHLFFFCLLSIFALT